MKTSSLYFKKEQRNELHKLINFVFDYNMSCDSWDDYIQMLIYNEDEGTVVDLGQTYGECKGFEWIDTAHYVAPAGNQFLDIEEDQTYDIPNYEDLVPGFKTVKGEDILNLKNQKEQE